MNKFENIIKAVAEASDLRPCQILCKRRYQETIDARWVAVKLLREEGFYSSKIADLMGMTTRNVNYILFSVETRLSMHDKTLGNILETSRKQLGKSKEISSLNGL